MIVHRPHAQESKEANDGKNQQTDVEESAAVERIPHLVASVPTAL